MNKSKTIIITLIVTGFVVLTLLVVSVILAYSKSIDNQEFKDLETLDNNLMKLGVVDLDNPYITYNNDYIDYGFLYNTRFNILRKAYSRFNLNNDDYQGFINRNLWVKDYALFMTIKGINNGNPLSMWDDQYKFRENNTIQYVEKMYKNEISFWIFIQYEFYNQWYKLKKYANDKGIKIIGDIPIYVPYDSVEICNNLLFFFIFLFGLSNAMEFGEQYALALTFVALITDTQWDVHDAMSIADKIDKDIIIFIKIK